MGQHHDHAGHAHEHEHEHEHDHDHGHEPRHADAHNHGHAGHHHHHPAPGDGQQRAFAISVALNTLFVGIEFAYGFVANSTALMADAGHNLSDVLGLLLSWGAIALERRQASQRYTYGLRGASILAALANAMLLLACGAIGWEALGRIHAPPAVQGLTVSLVAAAGIVINGVSAWLFMRGAKEDLNIRSAYLHMAGDAAISLGVALAGVVILFTGWQWLDPVVSLGVVLVIVMGTWNLLRESLQLALNAVPAQVDVAAVQAYLRGLPGVADVCDLHVWGLSTTENALTVQLVMPAGHPGDAFMREIGETLQQRFAIHHSTLQIALAVSEQACTLGKAAQRAPMPHGHAHAHHH